MLQLCKKCHKCQSEDFEISGYVHQKLIVPNCHNYLRCLVQLMTLSYRTGSRLPVTRKCLLHYFLLHKCCAQGASEHRWCFIVIRYCSEACSVAAKATAFCTCIFILKLWLCCHIVYEILVESVHSHEASLARFLLPAACPQQTPNGPFLDHTMCKVWSVSILT